MFKGVTDRIDALDGIRGMAIALVIAVHWVQPYFPYAPGGYVGVDVFFVLSGFLITRTLWRSRPQSGLSLWMGFERRRIERLYPALVLFLAVGTMLVWAFGEPVSGPDAVRAAGIAVVQLSTFVVASGSHAVGPFGHTWSLSVEWLFYLVWPIAVILLRRRLSSTSVAVGTLAAACLMYAVSTSLSAEWFYFGPLSRAAQILVGAALALFLASGRQLRVPFIAGLGAAVALVAWTVLGSEYQETPYRFVGYPLATVAAVLLLACALQTGGRSAKLLAWSPLALIGKVSYSLYLWHVLGTELFTPDNTSLPRVGIATVAVLGTAVTTAASYWFLERPVLVRSEKRRLHARGELVSS